MKKSISIILAVIMTISLAFVMTGCSGKDDNTLVMATNAAFPPYEYMDGDKIVGIDAEIAQAIADKLGKELKIENVEFGSIVGGVQDGKYDMGIAGMTVTEERKKNVNFSDSYATGVQVVIVKTGGAITELSDLDGTDYKIGVQQDTTGDIYASDDVENGGYGKDRVISYKTGADAVQALLTGKVDCVLIDNEPAKSFVAVNDGLEILPTEYIIEDYAICVSKKNDELLNDINKALKELTDDGTVQKIIDKYISAE